MDDIGALIRVLRGKCCEYFAQFRQNSTLYEPKNVWNFKMKAMLSLLFVTYCMCLLTCLC